MRQAAPHVLVAIALVFATACGGDSPTSPAPPPGLGAPQNVAIAVSGPSQALAFSVTITWSPPPTGPTPTGYVVEMATRNDFSTFIPTLVTGTSRTFDFQVPVYRVSRWRVRALDGTVEGPASQVISHTFALPASESSLPAPTPLAPADRSTFDLFPRTTTFSWSSVAGAVAYGFEIDYCQPSNPWCLDGSQSEILLTSAHPFGPSKPLTNTSFTFDFVGAQPGRWTVWAIDSSGRMGAKSDWRSFNYTR